MTRLTRRNTALLVFWFMIFLILRATDEEDQRSNTHYSAADRPSIRQIVADTISVLKKSHQSSWEKIKTIVHDLQSQYFPPNLDFRSTGEESALGGNTDRGAGEKMKEAVKKSIGTSKATVEESARSAAEVAGEAVHKTMEKMKEDTSDEKESPHDEL